MFFSRFYFSFFKNTVVFVPKRGMSVIAQAADAVAAAAATELWWWLSLVCVERSVSYFQKHQNKQWMDDVFVKWWRRRRMQKVYDYSTATMNRWEVEQTDYIVGLMQMDFYRILMQILFHNAIFIYPKRTNFNSFFRDQCEWSRLLQLQIDLYLQLASPRLTTNHTTKTLLLSDFEIRTGKRMATIKRQKTPTRHTI